MTDTLSPTAPASADVAAWTAIAETLRDSPESFSPYAAAGVAKQFLSLVAAQQTALTTALAEGERLRAAIKDAEREYVATGNPWKVLESLRRAAQATDGGDAP